jgi:hypothetical protein
MQGFCFAVYKIQRYSIVQYKTDFRKIIYNIEIYKHIILVVVLYGCETWSITLREEHRLRVFEKKVLRRIFAPKRDEVTGEWKSFTVRNLIICTHPQISLGRSNQGE